MASTWAATISFWRCNYIGFKKTIGENESAAKIFNIISALWPQKTPQFAAYDRAIKMGKMDYEEALTDLVLS